MTDKTNEEADPAALEYELEIAILERGSDLLDDDDTCPWNGDQGALELAMERGYEDLTADAETLAKHCVATHPFEIRRRVYAVMDEACGPVVVYVDANPVSDGGRERAFEEIRRVLEIALLAEASDNEGYVHAMVFAGRSRKDVASAIQGALALVPGLGTALGQRTA